MKDSKILMIIFVCTLLVVCARRRTPYEPEDTAVANIKMPQQDIPWPSLADSPWPMASVNPQGIARSAFPGPDMGEVVWSLDLASGRQNNQPAIGPDGTIYFSMDFGLVAVSPEGNIKWRILTERRINTPKSGAVIAADSTIYI